MSPRAVVLGLWGLVAITSCQRDVAAVLSLTVRGPDGVPLTTKQIVVGLDIGANSKQLTFSHAEARELPLRADVTFPEGRLGAGSVAVSLVDEASGRPYSACMPVTVTEGMNPVAVRVSAGRCSSGGGGAGAGGAGAGGAGAGGAGAGGAGSGGAGMGGAGAGGAGAGGAGAGGAGAGSAGAGGAGAGGAGAGGAGAGSAGAGGAGTGGAGTGGAGTGGATWGGSISVTINAGARRLLSVTNTRYNGTQGRTFIVGSSSDGNVTLTLAYPGFATPLNLCGDQSRLVLIQYSGPEGGYLGGILQSNNCGDCQIAITQSGPVGAHIVGTFSGTVQENNGMGTCNANTATITGSFDAIREADQ